MIFGSFEKLYEDLLREEIEADMQTKIQRLQSLMCIGRVPCGSETI
jgi:hypothetical protein